MCTLNREYWNSGVMSKYDRWFLRSLRFCLMLVTFMVSVSGFKVLVTASAKVLLRGLRRLWPLSDDPASWSVSKDDFGMASRFSIVFGVVFTSY